MKHMQNLDTARITNPRQRVNPVEEGLVYSPEQYVYSSAIDYADEKGLLDVIRIR